MLPWCLTQSVCAAGTWQQVQQSSSDQCLTAFSPTNIDTESCKPTSDVSSTRATQQLFRVVRFKEYTWQALESYAYPGLCVVLDQQNQPTSACSCGELALQVWTTLLVPFCCVCEKPAPWCGFLVCVWLAQRTCCAVPWPACWYACLHGLH